MYVCIRPEINNVTVRMLLHMNAGIPSYNDTLIHNLTVNEPDYDINPWDYLVLQGQYSSFQLSCHPGINKKKL